MINNQHKSPTVMFHSGLHLPGCRLGSASFHHNILEELKSIMANGRQVTWMIAVERKKCCAGTGNVMSRCGFLSPLH